MGRAAANLLEMVPCRARDWDEDGEGRVRVLVPRYGGWAPGRWIAARLGRPHIPVRLDEAGSRVWKACDGRHSVGEIADQLGAALPGAGGDDVHERLARFLRELEYSRFIRMERDRSTGAPGEPAR